MGKYAFAKVEVGGIQKFISETGKLKEMIGASEIINFISMREFYFKKCLEDICPRSVDRPEPGKSDWYITTQANAGALCLIMPDREKAAMFLEKISREIIESFPTLPVYYAQAPMDWTVEGYREARAAVENIISQARATRPVKAGAPMLPVLLPARLDGRPAVELEGEDREPVSLASQCKRNDKMLKKSRERLHDIVKLPEEVSLIWEDDIEKLMGGEKNKIALILMDGNDLGKLFRERLLNNDKRNLESGIANMLRLSDTIRDATHKAFAAACAGIVELLLKGKAASVRNGQAELIMPLRPLVLGGDDISVIIRADMALPFVSLFAREFEKKGGDAHLSLGIGMVVMPRSYPFAKARRLAESLLESAKHATLEMSPRPSSLNYLVLTEEMEGDLDSVLARIFTAEDGSILTGKPFILGATGKDGATSPADPAHYPVPAFLRDGMTALEYLPRSGLREAWTACRKGREAAKKHWSDMKANIARGLGGRNGKLMSEDRFQYIFPGNFIFPYEGEDKRGRTRLGDYLELARLLPADVREWQYLKDILQGE